MDRNDDRLTPPDLAVFGRNLRRAMTNKGLAPREVQQATGASPSAVSNWRRRGVPEDIAERLAEILGVRPEQISPQYYLHALGVDDASPVAREIEAERVKIDARTAQQKDSMFKFGESQGFDDDETDLGLFDYVDRVERIRTMLMNVRLYKSDFDLLEHTIQSLADRK